MRIEELYEAERGRLEARLAGMLGSRAAAEDVAQEAVLRTWQRVPLGLDPEEQTAWLNRTATNLAIDQLRRRRFISERDPEELELRATTSDTSEVLAAREALSALTPQERVVLLLRFELGLSHGEIGGLLEISSEAARKRCARARHTFASILRDGRTRERPVIVVAAREGFDDYRRWLETAGGDARKAERAPGDFERQIAEADAFVLGGGITDLHPSLYRERLRVDVDALDPAGDLRALRHLRLALGQGIPVVGICLGHQLLNVALGGSLFQDIHDDGVTGRSHRRETHAVSTVGSSFMRRVLGRNPQVTSEHRQAMRRQGSGLRIAAESEDGVIEAFELPARRLTLGVQWHPEVEEAGEAGDRLAAALVEAASR